MLLDAIAGFQKEESLYGLGTSLAGLALLYQVCDRLVEARLQYQEALAIFTRIGDRSNIAKTLGNIGLLYREEGEMQYAIDYQQMALSAYREIGEAHGEATILVNLAHLFQTLEESVEADKYAAEARNLCIAKGYQDQLMRLESTLARSLD